MPVRTLERLRLTDPMGFGAQIAFLLLLVAALLLAQHGGKDWSQPLRYNGDGLSYALMVKQVIEGGWFPGANDLLGAPFGANSLDYPVTESTHYFVLKLLALFGDWVFAFNAFVLLSYFAAAAAAFWALWRFGFPAPWPLVGAILFAFQPYHAMRVEHLFLASYHAVPLGIWLAWTVWRSGEGRPWRDSLAATVVCGIVAGSSGIYYAFFTCFLAVVAALAGLVSADRAAALRRAALVLVLVGGTTFLNVLPSILFKAAHGPNPEVAIRPFSDTERYALKPIQLLLPHPDHRVAAARALAKDYATKSPEMNENQTSSIGVLGVGGLFYLLWAALRALRGAGAGADVTAVVAPMSAFTLGCLLLASIGGLGAVFSLLVSAQIRAYNRISIVIAFLALTGLLALAVRLFGSPGARRVVPLTAAAGLVAVGLYDQTTPFDLAQAAGEFRSDRAFVGEVERRLPKGAMVYQMPYQRYPETGRQVHLDNYDPARGYLNSRDLRWSYGHVKGREGDRWMLALREVPIEGQVDIVARSGFSAMVVDRRGFEDRGKAVEEALRARLGAPIAASADGQMVAYAVTPTGNKPVPYAEVLPAFERVDFSAPAIPKSIAKLSGMSVHEPWGRWTEGPLVRIDLAQPLPREFTLEIVSSMAFPPNVDTPIEVRIGSATQTFKVSARETSVVLPFKLDAEARAIEIRIPRPTSPAELGFNQDPRKLGLGLKSIAARRP